MKALIAEIQTSIPTTLPITHLTPERTFMYQKRTAKMHSSSELPSTGNYSYNSADQDSTQLPNTFVTVDLLL